MSKMYFLPFRPAFDSAGVIVPGSQHYFTLAGTNTPSAPYADAGLTTRLANPLVADGVGYLPPVYLDPAVSYRVRIYDADAEAGVDTPLEEYDPYVPALANTDILSDLAADTGFTLIMHKSSQSGTFARSGAAWARLGGMSDDNLFNFIDPLLDDAILDRTNATALDTYIQTALDTGRLLRTVNGTYVLANTIVDHLDGSGIIGAGDGDLHDVGPPIVAPTIFKWIGASGGTIAQAKSGGSQFISGNHFRGICFDGNSGLAAVGLNLVGTRKATIDIVGAHFTTAILKMEPDPSLSEPAGCSENTIERLTGYQTNVGDGALLLETSTADWNCSQNRFNLISGDFANGYAVDIQGSDAELFDQIKLFATVAGAVGVRFKSGATIQQTARNNTIDYLGVTPASGLTIVPALAEGTADGTVASTENRILALDDQNNPTLPVVHTGASLFWSPISAPIGMRSQTMAVGSLVEVTSSGKIIQSGISTSVAANASTIITFAKALTTGAMAVSVTPKTAATPFFAAASATQLVITNPAGGAATDFYWRVEGY